MIGLKKIDSAEMVVVVKPEDDNDWMIRGETIDGTFTPDLMPADYDSPGKRRLIPFKILTDKYAEKHFRSFTAAKNFCKTHGWKAVEGY